MNAVNQMVKCGKCKTELNEAAGLPPNSREPCPNCNSKTRFFEVEMRAELRIYTELRAKARHTAPGKPFLELRTGDSLHMASNIWNKLERVIDRTKDLYKEVITDRKTGKEIRHCEETLSKHTGHGSAKKK